MKILEEKFEHTGFNFEQVIRKGNHAVYRKTKKGVRNYETIVITSHNGIEIMGRHYDAAEVYPTNSQWGQNGFTNLSLEDAVKKFNELSGEEIDYKTYESSIDRNDNIHKKEAPIKKPEQPKQRRKRGSFSIELPDGEFTVKSLAEKYETYPAQIHNILKSQFQGKYKVVRREKVNGGRGKPTNVLAKV